MVGLTMTEPPWLGAQTAFAQRQSMTQKQSHKLLFPPVSCPEQALSCLEKVEVSEVLQCHCCVEALAQRAWSTWGGTSCVRGLGAPGTPRVALRGSCLSQKWDWGCLALLAVGLGAPGSPGSETGQLLALPRVGLGAPGSPGSGPPGSWLSAGLPRPAAPAGGQCSARHPWSGNSHRAAGTP